MQFRLTGCLPNSVRPSRTKKDVPIPMKALELIWCSYRDIAYPLNRLSSQLLRRNVFRWVNGLLLSAVYMEWLLRLNSGQFNKR